MKKEMKYILVLAVFLLMQPMSIYAKDKLATCTYANYIHIGQKQVKLNFTLYDDGSVGKPVKKGESYNNDGFYWTYSKNFDSEYSGALYNSSTKKLSASCPKIYICQPSTGQVEVYSHSVACSDGDDPQALSGDLTVENQTPVAQDKSKTYCTRNKSLRNESYNVDVKFYLDSNGNKRFSVMRSGTNIGADAAYNELVSVGSYTFGIASQDVAKFYSSSCSTVTLYFDLNGTSSSITITSSKPSDVNNGSTDVNNASNDNGQDATGGTSGNQSTNVGDTSEGCDILGGTNSKTVELLAWVIKIIRLGVPILIIILGMTDFLKILFSGEDKVFKEAFTRFAKRLGIGVCIIFIPYIIQLVIHISGVDTQYGIDNFFCGIVDAASGTKVSNSTTTKTCGDRGTLSECNKDGKCNWNYSGNFCETISTSTQTKTCGDRGTLSECNKDGNCKWNYSGSFCEVS